MLSVPFFDLPSHISLISFNCCSTLVDGRMQPWKKNVKAILDVIYQKVIELNSVIVLNTDTYTDIEFSTSTEVQATGES